MGIEEPTPPTLEVYHAKFDPEAVKGAATDCWQ